MNIFDQAMEVVRYSDLGPDGLGGDLTDDEIETIVSGLLEAGLLRSDPPDDLLPTAEEMERDAKADDEFKDAMDS